MKKMILVMVTVFLLISMTHADGVESMFEEFHLHFAGIWELEPGPYTDGSKVQFSWGKSSVTPGSFAVIDLGPTDMREKFGYRIFLSNTALNIRDVIQLSSHSYVLHLEVSFPTGIPDCEQQGYYVFTINDSGSVFTIAPLREHHENYNRERFDPTIAKFTIPVVEYFSHQDIYRRDGPTS